eukprot:m.1033612 g.1033612  ORF g.1033612 m.1033612 type:complete len:588 (+) comp24132_c0_seq8:142-1905(+)
MAPPVYGNVAARPIHIVRQSVTADSPRPAHRVRHNQVVDGNAGDTNTQIAYSNPLYNTSDYGVGSNTAAQPSNGLHTDEGYLTVQGTEKEKKNSYSQFENGNGSHKANGTSTGTYAHLQGFTSSSHRPSGCLEGKNEDFGSSRNQCTKLISLFHFLVSILALILAIVALVLSMQGNECHCQQTSAPSPEVSESTATNPEQASSLLRRVGALELNASHLLWDLNKTSTRLDNEISGLVDRMTETYSEGSDNMTQMYNDIQYLEARVDQLDVENINLQQNISNVSAIVQSLSALNTQLQDNVTRIAADVASIDYRNEILGLNVTALAADLTQLGLFSDRLQDNVTSIFVNVNRLDDYANVSQVFNSFVTNLEASTCEHGIENISAVGSVGCAAAAVAIPPGTIAFFSGTTPPHGHLLCDGSQLLEIEYPDLFVAIGRTYGGESGNGTFRLPDLTTGNRYVRAAGEGLSVGATQDDATALNGLTVAVVQYASSYTVSRVLRRADVESGARRRWTKVTAMASPILDTGMASMTLATTTTTAISMCCWRSMVLTRPLTTTPLVAGSPTSGIRRPSSREPPALRSGTRTRAFE